MAWPQNDRGLSRCPSCLPGPEFLWSPSLFCWLQPRSRPPRSVIIPSRFRAPQSPPTELSSQPRPPAPLPRPAPQVGIARGKTCDYDPHAFGRPDRGVAYDKYNCATSPYGMFSVDWAMGGNPDNKPGKVTILDMGPPPSVVPGCEKGRERQVLITRPVGNVWVFPRFLDCP